ncbi:MAG TPA: hypothetical protein H9734_11900 [Candidatus Fusicatenibacter merdavium]|uniref:Uncharacterized protein n=1 Tax=Candidatus Fusicatenibacter merdavium TaxID=2838600 RepID=A0A9D1XEY4_9FIRM|nr:hypothetical protein [Candidatus Fusicatenibacter merdavium]
MRQDCGDEKRTKEQEGEAAARAGHGRRRTGRRRSMPSAGGCGAEENLSRRTSPERAPEQFAENV